MTNFLEQNFVTLTFLSRFLLYCPSYPLKVARRHLFADTQHDQHFVLRLTVCP